MTRRHYTVIVIAATAALLIAVSIAWCPPDACLALHIRTYTISRLDEYRQYLLDEAAFTSSRHARAIRLSCADLRDEVVTALQTERLMLRDSRPMDAEIDRAQQGSLQVWHQGRLLHLQQAPSASDQQLGAWARTLRDRLTDRTNKDLAFLPRLFGGVILHIRDKHIPIILFSEESCV